MVDMFLAIVLLAGQTGGAVGASGGEAPQIPGVWRGTSQCLVKNSPCQDETNVYRISAVPGKNYRFKVAESKVVDGQEVAMGPALNWDYDPRAHTLTFAVGNGHFWLKVDGDKMDGGLMLADMTVYRKIHLERDKTGDGVKK
jgi:hypothetical protein